MRYAVEWDNLVEQAFTNALTSAWLARDLDACAALEEVADWVEANLAHRPQRHGRFLPELKARVAPVPLVQSNALVAVTFTIDSAARRVRIVRLTFCTTELDQDS